MSQSGWKTIVIHKRSHEPLYKKDTSNEAKRLRPTTFAISKWKTIVKKTNMTVAMLQKAPIW